MYVRKNVMKDKVANGEIVVGMELWLRDPRMIELLAQAGFDFVAIEYEHIARDWEAVEDLIRTAEANGLTPLFRCEQVFDDQPPVNQIIKALKAGAQIIKVPHVETAETIRKVVDAVKYPPLGHRGLATCDRTALDFFPTEDTPLDVMAYVNEANEQTMIWAIIESPRAVENIDEILAVDGLDVVGFGHQDYALAAGLTSDDAPEIDEARERVREAVKRSGKAMWWNTHDPDDIAAQAPKGIQMFLMGVDTIHINQTLRNISAGAKRIPA